MLRHIVVFRVYDGVSEAQVDAAIGMLDRLADLPEVQDWRVARSLDTRKGTVIIENAVFRDAAERARFHDDQRHASTAEAMAKIADWWVADYEE
jgi:hypothetical protein